MVAAWPEHLGLYKLTGYIKWCLVSVRLSEFIVNRLTTQLSNSKDSVSFCTIVINHDDTDLKTILHTLETFTDLYILLSFNPFQSYLHIYNSIY